MIIPCRKEKNLHMLEMAAKIGDRKRRLISAVKTLHVLMIITEQNCYTYGQTDRQRDRHTDRERYIYNIVILKG